jgi:hypothetical protein
MTSSPPIIVPFNPHDVDKLKKVLGIESDPKAWERLLAFKFDFVAQRVRRRIPDADLLYERVKHVFDFYEDKKDAKKGKPLFNADAKHKSKLVLKLLKSGLLTDPPGFSFYVKKMDSNGIPMKDKYGLQLYRSIRGTSLLESLHQMLARSFGHTYAGAWYSDSLLTLILHYSNWRASIRNRPGFPKLRHYDGQAIDKVNEYYEKCFGRLKYPTWICMNDCLLDTAPGTTLFGIVPIADNPPGNSNIVVNGIVQVEKIRNTRDYIALRQGDDIGYSPVEGEIETKLFLDFMQEAIRSGTSLSSNQTFIDMASEWNPKARGKENGIYKKTAVLLARRYKRWRKNSSKREAINAPESRQLSNALEHVPLNVTAEINDLMQPEDNPFSNLDHDFEAGNNDSQPLHIPRPATVRLVDAQRSYKKCRKCSDPTCKGGYSGICKVHNPGRKRTCATAFKRKCGICKQQSCKGTNNRKKCPHFREEDDRL